MSAPVNDVALAKRVLSAGLARPARDGRYTPHPGELSWWLDHADPRFRPPVLITTPDGFAFVSPSDGEVAVFTFPGRDRESLLDRALGGQDVTLEAPPSVGWVAETDDALMLSLLGRGFLAGASGLVCFERAVGETPRALLADGYRLGHVKGEGDAWARRAASFQTFESTMTPDAHHARYLAFMRSPAYAAQRDLVVWAPDGTVAAFAVWWLDPESGVAQIEPLGTHPDHRRRGLARALIGAVAAAASRACATRLRVSTELGRLAACATYEACGFREQGRVVWWGR